MSDEAPPPMQLDDISHDFGDLTVLLDVSLTLQSGESVAVVGPNAAGKTTLIRVASGLLTPDRGEVVLEGESLESLDRSEIARRLSLLRQASPQVFDFSALELVLMGFHARTERFSLPSKDQHRRALEAMEDLEIDDLADRPASVLSGGELQRTLMARTMVSATDLWLLDEPTSHLDVRHQVALLEQVQRHVEAGGTALAVLHDLSAVHRFFDRVLILDDGEPAGLGPTDETLTESRLSEVFDVPLVRGEVEGQSVWVVDSDALC